MAKSANLVSTRNFDPIFNPCHHPAAKAKTLRLLSRIRTYNNASASTKSKNLHSPLGKPKPKKKASFFPLFHIKQRHNQQSMTRWLFLLSCSCSANSIALSRASLADEDTNDVIEDD